MEITEPRRLYQQLAADLKERIEQGVYLVGDKLPAERFIADEKNVSRTVVREAIIMLEVEGYVEVRKGSGIHVVSNQPRHQQAADNNMEFANYGPFELLQARAANNASVIPSGICSSTFRSLWRRRTPPWRLSWKKCGPSVVITRTGKNCTNTLIPVPSITGVMTTIKSSRR